MFSLKKINPMDSIELPLKSKKRPDIQGLRAIAIVGVLLFHVWPEVFRNGYLGVDM